jgi:hypothetical protein
MRFEEDRLERLVAEHDPRGVRGATGKGVAAAEMQHPELTALEGLQQARQVADAARRHIPARAVPQHTSGDARQQHHHIRHRTHSYPLRQDQYESGTRT